MARSVSRTPATLSAVIAIVMASVVLAAQAPPFQLPMEPPRDFGTSITASMEGWFDNPDGTKTFIVGYLNRNAKMEIDVPIGPNNNIEPETCYSSRSHSLPCLIKNNGSSHETLSCEIVISRYEDPNSSFLSIIDVYPEMIINKS